MQRYQQVLIPDWLGNSIKNGVQKGPKALTKAIQESNIKVKNKLLKEYFADNSVEVIVPEPNPNHAIGEYAQAKYWPEIKQICLETKKDIIAVLDNGKVPVVLMGDDSSLIGVLSGIAKKYGNDYGLIYFDAHGDIHIPGTSPSGRLFGMPLSHLLGFGIPELVELNGKEPSLKGGNIVMLGTRSVEEAEPKFFRQYGVKVYAPNYVNGNPSEKIFEEIKRRLYGKKLKNAFIHVDLDVFDPEESKGVWTAEPNGVKTEKAAEIISKLVKEFNCIGLCVSEYNPDLDQHGKTKKIALEVIRAFIGQ